MKKQRLSMDCHANRLTTFKKWEHKEGNCAPYEMAKAGFYELTRTCVKCYYCAKELDGWEEEDDPWSEHRKHAGYCPYVKKYDSPPDPEEFSVVEALELERDRLMLMVDQKCEAYIQEVEKCAEATLEKLEESVGGDRVRKV